MYYKSRKLQSARQRITEQLKDLGWQERECRQTYKPNDRVELMASYNSPHICDEFFDMAKVNDWRDLVTRQKRNLAHLYLHDITPEDLAPDQHPAYEEWLHVLHEAQRIYDQTLPKADERNT